MLKIMVILAEVINYYWEESFWGKVRGLLAGSIYDTLATYSCKPYSWSFTNKNVTSSPKYQIQKFTPTSLKIIGTTISSRWETKYKVNDPIKCYLFKK